MPSRGFGRLSSVAGRVFWVVAVTVALVGSVLVFSAGRAVAAPDVVFDETLGGSGRIETYPSGLEIAPDGAIIAADTGADRVVKYNPDGSRAWVYGSYGSAQNGELANPRDVGIDSVGNVYIADTGNGRIIKLNAAGTYQDVWTQPNSPMGVTVSGDVVYVADAGVRLVRIFDTSGNQIDSFGQDGACVFDAIRDVDAASNGDIYIANYLDHNVLRMSSAGVCIGLPWGTGVPGGGPGEFRAPYGVRVANDPFLGESVYIADSNNDRVQVFDLTGTYLAEFGSTGAYNVPGTHTELRRVAVATDGTGDVWTADLWGWRLQRFDRTDGAWSHAQTIGGIAPPLTADTVFNEVRQIGFAADGSFWAADTVHHRFVHMSAAGDVLGSCGIRGWDPGEFNWPESAAVDHTTGDLWLTDTKQSRLQVLKDDCSEPVFVGAFGTGLDQFYWPTSVVIRQSDGIAFVVDRQNDRIVSYDVATRTPIEAYESPVLAFNDPRRVALDPNTGNLYVADTKNHRIVELSDVGGADITQVRVLTAGLGAPEGVAVGDDGTIYVADTGNNRVVVLNADGSVATTFTSPDGFYAPGALSIGPDDRLYVSDTHNDRIQVYTTTTTPPTAPVNVSPPLVSGTAEVGTTLSAGPGSWTGTVPITYTYQWQRCDGACVDVPGETDTSYLVTTSDVGSSLAVVVTATNIAGSASASSAETGVVPEPPVAPVNVVLPSVSGVVEVGETLSASSGSWSGTEPISYGFQWQRCDGVCVDVPGEMDASYLVTTSDVGSSLAVVVTATNSAGSASVSSAETGVVPVPPVAPSNVVLPLVSGVVEVGETLSASSGSWSGTEPISYSYQWQRCDGACFDVIGETLSTYVVSSGDVGSSLAVVVTATNSAGSASVSSAETSVVPEPPVPVAPTNVVLPSVSGVAEVGGTLSASSGSWSGTEPISYSLQWQRCDGVCVDVVGETGSSYLVTVDDVGSSLVVVETATNSAGSVSVSSAETGVVPVPPVPPVVPRFVDTAGNVHEADIELIAAAGITMGCNPPVNDRYCPADVVTRGQMAAFLSRALDLAATSVDFFVDDDGSVFEDDINRLAAAGITRGCNPPTNDRYCANSVVSRGQMAAFLNRGLDLAATSVDFFVDDDGSVFEDDINRLAAAGITKGCNPPINDRYCPDASVRRDQMASFLTRGLNL